MTMAFVPLIRFDNLLILLGRSEDSHWGGRTRTIAERGATAAIEPHVVCRRRVGREGLGEGDPEWFLDGYGLILWDA